MSYKRWILIASFFFIFGTVSGLVLTLVNPTNATSIIAEDITGLEQFTDLMGTLPQWSILIFIFIKNVSAVLISIALSPFLCIVPFIALILNGWVLGWVSTLVIQEKSISYLLAGVLPHGIIEIPAFIMGEAVAFSVGTAIMLAIFKKDRRRQLLPNLKQNLRYLAIAIGLLLPAAIIETYVVPLLLH